MLESDFFKRSRPDFRKLEAFGFRLVSGGNDNKRTYTYSEALPDGQFLAELCVSEDGSITGRVRTGGIFVASIRDYDSLLQEKPPYSPPYIHRTDKGQRVSFQTWTWNNDNYNLVQYIIDDEDKLQVSKFACEYRAVRRKELTDLLTANGCSEVVWKFPEETGFYQPIVIARQI